MPTTMIVAMKTPITRWPGMPPSKGPTTIGATAPETRMVSASDATRHVIIRVRSPYGSVSPAASVMSAGIATYGTWKNANAVAVARNATHTQTAPRPAGEDPGEHRREQHRQGEPADQQVRAARRPTGSGCGRRGGRPSG